jgi:hypothetical protein
MFDNILYVVGSSDIPVQLLVSFSTPFMNRHNTKFVPLLWQFFLIPNKVIKFVDPHSCIRFPKSGHCPTIYTFSALQ